MATDLTQVIRPAAVISGAAAACIVRSLLTLDVSRSGVWNATPTIWQRYSGPWNGPGATRGSAELVGSIAIAYETPVRHHITIYRVTVTAIGLELGWSVDRLCDDALGYGGLTLAGCPRAELASPPVPDPFVARR